MMPTATGHRAFARRQRLCRAPAIAHLARAVSRLIPLLMLTAVTSMSARAEGVDVLVEVSGLRSSQGRLLVALHDDRRAFPSRWDRAVVTASAAAAEGAVTVPLRLPRPGRFALIVVHDEDGDGRMSKSALGLPREGYATGRNAQTLAFPSFEPARLDWEAGTRVSVRLYYP